MKKISTYVQNSSILDEALQFIATTWPCFVNREYIEMDYSLVTITTRKEDVIKIEKILGLFV